MPCHKLCVLMLQKLAMEKPCARYDELYAQELHSPAVKEEERVNAVSALALLIIFCFIAE